MSFQTVYIYITTLTYGALWKFTVETSWIFFYYTLIKIIFFEEVLIFTLIKSKYYYILVFILSILRLKKFKNKKDDLFVNKINFVN